MRRMFTRFTLGGELLDFLDALGSIALSKQRLRGLPGNALQRREDDVRTFTRFTLGG